MKEYNIYYDESKENGYWHGILFVPANKHNIVISYLSDARESCGFIYRLHFQKIGENEPIDSPRIKLTESYINIGVASLQQQKFQKFKPAAKIGKSLKFISDIGSKFIVYRVLNNSNYHLNRNSLIERTLKSALKNSLHYLFDNSEKICINRVVFEGEELQGLNDKTILSNLKNQIRSNIKFLPNQFTLQSSDHNKLQQGQDKDDSFILQLCDSMLGATRFLVVSNSFKHPRGKISSPLSILLDYVDEPYIRMKRSRYYRGFSLVQAEWDGFNWEFNKLRLKEENFIQTPKLF